MSLYSDLLADIYSLTNRPDREADTKVALRSATLKMHHSDFYPKDLFETGLTFSAAATLLDFEYRTYIPRWRALKYLRKYDAITDTPGEFFTVVDPTDILDSYAVHKENVCYLAGELLRIRSDTAISNALIGCYLNPQTSEAAYDSWIAVEKPDLIVFEAAGMVHRMLGNEEQGNAYKNEAAILLVELRNS